MATTNHSKSRPGRTLLSLLILVLLLAGIVFGGYQFKSQSLTPNLAIDLAGGRQFILTPVATNNAEVTDDAINQAISIIRQRVDASGVSEAEITSQGGKNIVVSLPGNPSDDVKTLVSKSAQMRFRPVLVIASPEVTDTSTEAATADGTTTDGTTATDGTTTDGTTATDGSGSTATTGESSSPATTEESSSPDASDDATKDQSLGAPGRTIKPAGFVTPVTEGEATATPAETATPEATATATPDATAKPAETATPDATATDGSAATPEATATDDTATDDTATDDTADGPSALSQITDEDYTAFAALDCTLPENRQGGNTDEADALLLTCDPDGTAKYILGPVEIEGTDIKNATSSLETTQTGQTLNSWQVNMDFTKAGGDAFATTTGRIASLDSPRNQFAMVLDGLVIAAPSVATTFAGNGITGGQATITGGDSGFSRTEASTLANQLKFGALPLTFDIKSDQQISATLGSEQLEKGLIAGGIGLILVVIYSLFQYRALGMVTIASLVVAAALTYGAIALLSWESVMGLRLSLPGVAGLIVAIGITADSFIVYFERIRDELRDGRPLAAAVDTGWSRAKRTILASDAVNFSAAVVLYQLAVGGVKGFAFMLGLTTLIDIIVVFMFTHPVMVLLARRPFFADGHHWSGLDPRRLGVEMAHYVGRGRVQLPKPIQDSSPEDDGRSKSSGKRPLATAGVAASASSGRLTIAERRAAAAASVAVSETVPDPDPGDEAPPSTDAVSSTDADETTDGEK